MTGTTSTDTPTLQNDHSHEATPFIAIGVTAVVALALLFVHMGLWHWKKRKRRSKLSPQLLHRKLRIFMGTSLISQLKERGKERSNVSENGKGYSLGKKPILGRSAKVHVQSDVENETGVKMSRLKTRRCDVNENTDCVRIEMRDSRTCGSSLQGADKTLSSSKIPPGNTDKSDLKLQKTQLSDEYLPTRKGNMEVWNDVVALATDLRNKSPASCLDEAFNLHTQPETEIKTHERGDTEPNHRKQNDNLHHEFLVQSVQRKLSNLSLM